MADLDCIWLFGRGSKFVGAGLAYKLYAHSVCDTTALLQLQLPLVVLHKCYAFTFTYFTFNNIHRCFSCRCRLSLTVENWEQVGLEVAVECCVAFCCYLDNAKEEFDLWLQIIGKLVSCWFCSFSGRRGVCMTTWGTWRLRTVTSQLMSPFY